MPNHLLYHTIYEANPWGHGGEKRTAQLLELYEEAGIKRCVYQTENPYSKVAPFSVFKVLFLIRQTFNICQFTSPRIFFRFVKSISLQYESLKKFFNEKGNLFVWESTKDIYYYLPFLAKKYNKKIIAIPHNLESLVPGQKSVLTGKNAPSEFLSEIKVLRQCDAVFCISREETLLLKLFNVNAYYLPYYPTNEIEQYLLSIRNQRNTRQKNGKSQILLLGSAINPPTRMGIESRINFFKKNRYDDIEVSIAGFGTAQLLPLIENSNNFIFLGELSVLELEKVLLNADAILIHQPATTGALSRIIEFLIAGITVIANEESARSYFGMDGVSIYYDDDQLVDLLKTEINRIPAIPIKPQIQYDYFEKKVKEYNS